MDRQFIEQLWKMIDPIVEPEGLELVELEYRPEGGRWMLRVYIDRPTGVTLADCELVSRQVGALLDIEDPIHHPYVLEVSSPGINRVLRREKDFQSFAGSPVVVKTSVKVNGRRNFSGTLRGVKDSNVLVETDGGLVEIGLENIDKARLNLSQEDLFASKAGRGSR
jgi:ribosome maturation factor RimP|uniref:Ribosome maturation factor RimP n=1 Tax=Desulfomonile tiedjei TaxID=2358 RepID=A0A7C4EX62_9BACT